MIIPPMAKHEVPEGNDASCKSLTVEVGYTLLGEFFETFANQKVNRPLYKKSDLQHAEPYQQLVALLEETAILHGSPAAFADLSIKGTLYKIAYATLFVFMHK